MELEIDRRLCLHKHVPKHLEIQHGVFAWSATRIFLVDALNEAERDCSNKSFYDLLERDSLQVYIRNFDSFSFYLRWPTIVHNHGRAKATSVPPK